MTLFFVAHEPAGMPLSTRLEAAEIAFDQAETWEEWRHVTEAPAFRSVRRRALHGSPADWQQFLAAYNAAWQRLVRTHGLPQTDALVGASDDFGHGE